MELTSRSTANITLYAVKILQRIDGDSIEMNSTQQEQSTWNTTI